MVGRRVSPDGPAAPTRAPSRACRDAGTARALGAAIRGLAEAPDLASAAVADRRAARAWLLRAERALVVRAEGDGARVAASRRRGRAARGRPDRAARPSPRPSAAADPGAARRRRWRRPWRRSPWRPRPGGRSLVDGPATRVRGTPTSGWRRFADLVSLAAADPRGPHPPGLAGRHRPAHRPRQPPHLRRPARGRGRARRPPRRPAQPGAARHRPLQGRQRPLRPPARRPGADRGRAGGWCAIARRGEAVTRIGGEEFAWILPRTDGAGTERRRGARPPRDLGRALRGGRDADDLGRRLRARHGRAAPRRWCASPTGCSTGRRPTAATRSAASAPTASSPGRLEEALEALQQGAALEDGGVEAAGRGRGSPGR